MRTSTFLAIVGVQNFLSSAQQNPEELAAQIPNCTLPCGQIAIPAVGCSFTNLTCHCSHIDELKALEEPCLKNSTCTSQELSTFESLQTEICQDLSANGTTSSPSPTSTPSEALQLRLGSGAVLLIGAVFFSWMV